MRQKTLTIMQKYFLIPLMTSIILFILCIHLLNISPYSTVRLPPKMSLVDQIVESSSRTLFSDSSASSSLECPQNRTSLVLQYRNLIGSILTDVGVSSLPRSQLCLIPPSIIVSCELLYFQIPVSYSFKK